MKCLHCWKWFCWSCWAKCKVNTAWKNSLMVQALTWLWISRWIMSRWRQNDKVREIVAFMMKMDKVSVAEVLEKYGQEFKEKQKLIAKKENRHINFACQFDNPMAHGTCIYCWWVKRHRDQFWWNCPDLISKYS